MIGIVTALLKMVVKIIEGVSAIALVYLYADGADMCRSGRFG